MDIKLVGVWYKYSPSKTALENISLDLKGRATIIMGPNASGKTTLLKVISLIYRPWKGKVLVDHEDYWGLSRRRQLFIRRRIVYVHEKPVFVRGTILDNILLGPRIRGMNVSKTDLVDKASQLLEIFNLGNILNLKPKALSAGQLQLVSIIRALILEPKLLVLDEPTANLDNDKRKILLDYLVEYMGKNGRKIIIATHDLFIPILIEDSYVVVLSNGKILGEGRSSEILDHEYKKLYGVLRKTSTRI